MPIGEMFPHVGTSSGQRNVGPVDGSCEHGATSTALGAEWLPFSLTIVHSSSAPQACEPRVCLGDYTCLHLGKLSRLGVPGYSPSPEIVVL